MASSYTSNYQLCQWEGTDKVLRTDFNGDNAKIDAALAEKAEVVFGTYTGDGTASRVISLGFTPEAVYLCGEGGEAFTAAGTAYLTGGVLFRQLPPPVQRLHSGQCGGRGVPGGGHHRQLHHRPHQPVRQGLCLFCLPLTEWPGRGKPTGAPRANGPGRSHKVYC